MALDRSAIKIPAWVVWKGKTYRKNSPKLTDAILKEWALADPKKRLAPGWVVKNGKITKVAKPKPKPVPRPKWIDEAPKAKRHGTNSRVGIILHSTESHDRPGTTDVRGVNAYLRSKDYGVHYIVDGEGNVLRGAYHKDLVYHAAGANATHIGIEQVGFARWTVKDWLWDDGVKRKQLQEVAELIAYICDQEGIAIRLSKTNGISLHSQWPEGGHTDPGKGYPWRYVLKQAKAHYDKYRNPQ